MSIRLRSLFLCLTAVWLLSSASARAAYDAFLQFESTDPALKTEGEVQVKGFEKAVEVLSFSLGISNPVNISSGGGGLVSGKAVLSELNIMKRFDSASPVLFAAAATGRHYDQVKLTLRTPGEDGVVFLVYTFKQVYVSSVQWSGSTGGDDRPTESVSFSYASIAITYSKQESNGTVTQMPTVTWDQVLNKTL